MSEQRTRILEALAEHRWSAAHLSDGDCACGWKAKPFQASTPWDQHRAHQADTLLASVSERQASDEGESASPC